MTPPTAPINRRLFAIAVAAATLCALGAGLMLASRAGAEGSALIAIGAVILAGGMLSVPAMLGSWLIKDDIWGLVVLGITAFRTVLGIGGMFVLIELVGLPRHAVVHALLAGVMLLTTAEAAAAVWQLQRQQAARTVASTDETSPRNGVATPARRSS
ncbi:MAG: hypothetical protein LAT64_10040 [Phycisphaerales bacterium]|nr:hypothetical protein [Planctomycetota bacterium]MCH8509090.1 hypothetical protein [Phycisphaerales bacterium]